MSLQDLVKSPPRNLNRCGIARLSDKLSDQPNELAALHLLLSERVGDGYVWSQRQLAEALQAEGHDVTLVMIRKHRSKECACR